MKSISFNTEMMRKVLDGSKVHTRRLYKRNYAGKVTNNPLGGMREKIDISKAPYQVGDKVWVKETFTYDYMWSIKDMDKSKIAYKSDRINHPMDIQWRSPAIMPQWASRITLEITDISVERLQDISHKDIIKEGFGDGYTEIGWNYVFGQTWNSIYEKKGFGWSKNPWVWVIEFKVVTYDNH